MNRRAFFRTLLLGALAALGAILGRRSCAGRGCNGCGEFARCSLPWKEARQ
jgi:hypothetical protein